MNTMLQPLPASFFSIPYTIQRDLPSFGATHEHELKRSFLYRVSYTLPPRRLHIAI